MIRLRGVERELCVIDVQVDVKNNPLLHLLSAPNQVPQMLGVLGRARKGRNLDMLACTSGVSSSCLPALPKHHRAIDCREEPEEHVGQQHPNRVLHAHDAFVSFGILRNEHLSEYAESDQIAEEDEGIDKEEKPGLDQWQHEHETRD